MLFKLTNQQANRTTHCGVLEFVADEGRIYVPYWVGCVNSFKINALRDFACLTVGDIIAINYNERIYELKVLETKPKDAVTIIECDMSVDFAPPVGYQAADSGSSDKRAEKDANKVYS
ncbi:unnamed protein product [Trichobilharzia regenti]|nr:unnamed protein product [Trichobilharzia regenti]